MPHYGTSFGVRAVRLRRSSAGVSTPGALSVLHQHGKRGPVRAPKLLVHVVQVDLDRALRNRELPTDVLVRQPLRNQTRNLILSGRQHTLERNIPRAAFGGAPDRWGDQLLRQPALTRCNGLKTRDQGAECTLFE